MKIATTSLCLLFLVFAYAIAVDAADPVIVYDDEGNPMEFNGTYMLLPVGGGGIETVEVSHDAVHRPCSLAIVEGETNSSGGLPVTITSCNDYWKPTEYVTTSSCLGFSFAYVPPNNCTNSSLWITITSDTQNDEFIEVFTGSSGAIGGSTFYIQQPSKSSGAPKYTYWINCSNPMFGYCQGMGVKKHNGLNRLCLLHLYSEPLLLLFQFRKIATTSLSLLFLVIAFAYAVAADDEIVNDAEGNPMEINGTYMLLPTPQVGAGGIGTVAVSHDAIHGPCSLAIVEGEPNSSGLPVTITSCHSSKHTNYVTTSSCLVFSFAFVPPNNCTNSSIWVLRTSDTLNDVFVEVLTGGSGAIGGSTFYIKPSRSASAAKYTYWLNCSKDIFGYCAGVGVKKDNGLNRLFLLHGQYHDPLLLQFHKVHHREKNGISMVV
ncbi:Kunitz-type trypsin inhibitor KTI1 [Senna tora]|uniref:Kunitz-type trypsin inhibitor KTI1 n=1 Tax=Senna tora TaxID=362788 RepID=A0A834W7M5_9FABA|nr:Kunitz-type trypsin inhibitor KTI1 [Senna tora]